MRSPFSRNITLLALVLMGIMLLPYIPVQLHPSPRSHRLSVTFNFPGASPEVVERQVVSRLESAFATLRGLQSIRSVSYIGSGSISLLFDRTTDIKKIRLEISTLIRQIYQRIEAPISYPQISFASDFEEQELLLMYTLSSSLSVPALRALVEEWVIPELSRPAGVEDIHLSGIPDEEYQVMVRETISESLGLETDDIQEAIQDQFAIQELGLVAVQENKGLTFRPVRYGTTLNINSPEEFLGSIPVAKRSARIIYLSELAEIERRERQPDRYFRINGERAVILAIYTAPGVNQIRLARTLREKAVEMNDKLAGQLQFRLVRDESEFLNDSLQKIARRTGASLLLLLLFLIVVKPKLQYLLLIGVSLLATLLLAVIVYYFFGLELHLYSIAGWTLSIGIILDNLIIMADHIRNQGNQKVFPAILAATLTTVGALSVVFYIEAEYRESLGDFSGIFTVNILISLAVALFFVPSLYRVLFSTEEKRYYSIHRKRRVVYFTQVYQRFVRFSMKYRKIVSTLLILAFGLPIFLLPPKWQADHVVAVWYNKTIGTTYYQRKLKPELDKFLGGSLRLFFQQRSNFFFQSQKQEKTKLFLRAKMPYGGTVTQLNDIINLIERQLASYSQIDQYQSRVNGPDDALIEITFKEEAEEGLFPYALKSELESTAIRIGSADFRIYGIGQGFNNELRGTQLSEQIQFLGYNYEQLWQLAQRAKTLFLQHLRIQSAFINAEPSYYEPDETYFLLRLPAVSDLQKSNLSPAKIGDLLQHSQQDLGLASSFRFEEQTFPVHLQTDRPDRNQLWNLRNIPYPLDSNQLYKHETYLELEETKGQQQIVRVDQQYQLVLAYEFIGDSRLGRQVMEQKLDTLKQTLPFGFEVGRYDRSSFWDGQISQSKMISMLWVAILFIFMISAILFNSLRQALVPLSLIIPGFIGIFLSVYLFDFRFDQGGFAAFLLVAGLSVNAGLLLVNDYNNYRVRYSDRDDISVFLKAFNSKIIPIVLTTLSTVLGLLPFVLFDKHLTFWYALALCTIGGMIFSTLGVYLFFPVLFLRKNRQQTGHL